MASGDPEPTTPAVKPVHRFPNELKPFPDSLGERGQTNRLPVYLQHFTVGSWPCLKPNLSLLLLLRWDTLIQMESDCPYNPKLSSFPVHPSGWISSEQADGSLRGSECAPPAALMVQGTAGVLPPPFSVLSGCRASTLSLPGLLPAVTGSLSLPVSLGHDWDDLGFTPLDHLYTYDK